MDSPSSQQCTTHKICHICNQEETKDMQRELFDEEDEQLEEALAANREEFLDYVKDNTEQGQLLAAVFKESTIMSIERLKKMQRFDPYIVSILQQVTQNENQWEEKYCIKDGILLARKENELQEKHWVIVVPAALAPSVLHDLRSSIYEFGHPDAQKLAKIASQ